MNTDEADRRKAPKELGEKKPKVFWTPAKLLDTLTGLDWDNYAYRWVNADPGNQMKKMAEGWEPISKLKGDRVEHQQSPSLDGGGSLVGSLTVYREMILMRMPKDLADARREYYDALTDGTEDALRASLTQQAAAGGAEVHGTINTGRRIIK